MSETSENPDRRWTGVLVGVTATVALVVGIVVGGVLYWGFSQARGVPAEGGSASAATSAEKAKVQWWTCSMHPEVRLPHPGLCPKCGMKLIPLKASAVGGPVLTISKEAKAMMRIETSPVERVFPTAHLRLVGKIAYDETRVAYITAWVPGRLDRLFVDYTGIPVRKGDHLVYLYSPDLYSAQEELIQARRAVKDLERSDVKIVKETAAATVDAARQKLRRLGLTDEQVAEVEERGAADDHVTIFSPLSGIVVHKNAQEGMYVQTGTRVYTVADLSQVWAMLDAYESDLIWLRYGQKVQFTTVSYPGEMFEGMISFIDPVLDAVTRTVKIRVNVPNADGRLKPEMFVNAVVGSQVAAGGRVMAPDLAGKWICPMHPEVIRDEPGKCPICEMALVTAESLGYVTAAATPADRPLVIPVSAALVTGKRAVVYVEKPGTEEPTYEGREVLLGPRAGDYYLVRAGVSEGERVVTQGSFMIDSALQIEAKPSMMLPGGVNAPQGEAPQTSAESAAAAGPLKVEAPAAFRRELAAVFADYFAAGKALGSDDAAKARASLAAMRDSLAKVEMKDLKDAAMREWMAHKAALEKLLGGTVAAKDLQAERELFNALSGEMTALARLFPPDRADAYYLLHCPMAFDGRGADWLQPTQQVLNPFFGSSMPACGEVTEMISGQDGTKGGRETGHE